jgi:hypothetical protein
MGKVWKNTPENFWAQVQPADSGCHEWQGKREKSGYGRVSWHGKKRLAHRVAMYLRGLLEDLDSKACVLHRCDNPRCCNPEHLFFGTHSDNTRDAVAKGRQFMPNNRGERSGLSKLTNAQASEVRRLYAAGGLSQYKLAAQFGVTQMAVSRITRGITYNDC